MTDTTSLCLNVKTGGAIVIDGRIWVMVMSREPRVVALKMTQVAYADVVLNLRPGFKCGVPGRDDVIIEFLHSSQTSQTRLRVSAPRSVSIKLEIADE